MIPHYPPHQGI